MGVFDSVIAKCSCGAPLDFQSKAGRCALLRYHFTSVPAEIAVDIIDQTRTCDNCGEEWIVKANIPRVAVSVVPVIEIDDPDEEWD